MPIDWGTPDRQILLALYRFADDGCQHCFEADRIVIYRPEIAIELLADPVPQMMECLKMLPSEEAQPIKESCNVGFVTPEAQELVANVIRSSEERAAEAKRVSEHHLTTILELARRYDAAPQGATQSPAPHQLLTNWREITVALGLTHDEQDKVKSLNDRFEGPIPKPLKGGQPIVRKDLLVSWWNGLALLQQEKANCLAGAKLSVEAQHAYGRSGTAMPEIGGGIKNRRADSKR